MRTAALMLAAMSLLVLSSTAEAQWNVERNSGNAVATTTGTDGQIQLRVGCQGTNHIVVLTLPGDAALSNGDVEARWDDGSTERYTLHDQDGTLSTSSTSPQGRNLVAKLRQRNTVRLRVAAGRPTEVTDRISLTGSSRAIRSLPCTSSRASAGRPAGRTDHEIRRILVNQSVARYSGSCPCPYNTDRGGRRCGGRSAYSRPGGASPLCYPSDVSDSAVEAYRARTR